MFPPTTRAEAKRLAATGDAGAVHEFHSESVGLPACPEPARRVTLDPSGLSNQQIAADLLAYFYQQGLDNDCGSVVFAFHNASEGTGSYTVGRVILDVNGSSHSLEVDVGDALSSTQMMFTVSY